MKSLGNGWRRAQEARARLECEAKYQENLRVQLESEIEEGKRRNEELAQQSSQRAEIGRLFSAGMQAMKPPRLNGRELWQRFFS